MKTLSVFDIAPTKENPRSSEGAFLRRKDGSIILIYSRFTAGILLYGIPYRTLPAEAETGTPSVLRLPQRFPATTESHGRTLNISKPTPTADTVIRRFSTRETF